MSARCLSDDNIEICIDYLAGDLPTPFLRSLPYDVGIPATEKAHRAMLNCLLVSKLLYKRASFHLYRTICVIDAPYKWQKNHQLLHSLSHNPHLSKLICGIEIYLKPVSIGEGEGTMACSASFIPGLLSLLRHESQNGAKNLVSLRVSSLYPTNDPESWFKMDDTFLTELYKFTQIVPFAKELGIQKIYISDLKHVPSSFIANLKPSIKNLTIQNVGILDTAILCEKLGLSGFTDTTSQGNFFDKFFFASAYSSAGIERMPLTFWKPFSKLVELECFLRTECDRRFFDKIIVYISHRLKVLTINTTYYNYSNNAENKVRVNDRTHVIDIEAFPCLERLAIIDHRSPTGLVQTRDTINNLGPSDIGFLASLFEVRKLCSLATIQASMRFSIKDKHPDGSYVIFSEEYYNWQRLDHQLASPKFLFISVVDLTIELEDFDTNTEMEAMLREAEYIRKKITENFSNLSRLSSVTFNLKVLPISFGTRKEILIPVKHIESSQV